MTNKEWFLRGMKTSIPIGLGYFAVSFSLGIAASNAGLTPIQGFICSALMSASAGESAGFTAILEKVPYAQLVVITIVANMRYILMSLALSQKINPKEKLIHRIIMGNYITDEFFGLAISQEDYANPYYTYGAVVVASPLWSLGTAIGIVMGNILPLRLVSALSVALYGMFLAIIIPPAKDDADIKNLIIFSFACSFLLSRLTNLSNSLITIILTITISAMGAFFLPREKKRRVK